MALDAIIVLGNDSGESKLSDIALSRVNRAIALYKAKGAKLIFSGGYSLQHKKDPGYREADLMKEHALKSHVPEEDILVEDKSRDTQGNVFFTKSIVKSHSWKNLLVVTSDFHILKAKYFFDFIYGDGFNITYEAVKTDLSEEELRAINEKERASIEVMKRIYAEKHISRGDDEGIGNNLRAFYARYE
jgi:uncharacterized SAM-binding protein YcdF (DUF218 family)